MASKSSRSAKSKSKSTAKTKAKRGTAARSRQHLSEIPRKSKNTNTAMSTTRRSVKKRKAVQELPSTRELLSDVARVGRKITRRVRKAL